METEAGNSTSEPCPTVPETLTRRMIPRLTPLFSNLCVTTILMILIFFVFIVSGMINSFFAWIFWFVLKQVKKLHKLCKDENSEDLVARVYPHINRLFQRSVASLSQSRTSNGLLLLVCSNFSFLVVVMLCFDCSDLVSLIDLKKCENCERSRRKWNMNY